MKQFLFAYSFQLFRYLLVAGVFYALFYVVKRDSWLRRKIQSGFPESKQIQREIKYSLLSIFVFVGSFIVIRFAGQNNYTAIYTDFHAHSISYFFLSILLLLICHDTYFYWTHRLLHLRIFMRFHKIHHMSHNTTPWTSFAFHPVEAMVQAGFIFVVFIFPLHPIAIAIVMTWQMLFNVIGHLGYELIPANLHNTYFGRLFNTSTHHNMHHHYNKSNYGLYFNFWDAIMKTNHPHYEKQYHESAHKMYSNK